MEMMRRLGKTYKKGPENDECSPAQRLPSIIGELYLL